jgi:hypothetical protein
MNRREFDKLLARDKHCLHCGKTDDTLIPQHRANRGFGGAGRKSVLNLPSNLIVFCAEANGLIESDAVWADRARLFGWKLSRWADPSTTPVYDLPNAVYCIIGDDWSRVELHNFGKGYLTNENESGTDCRW